MRFKKFFKSRTVRVITAALFIFCTLFVLALPSFAVSTSGLPTSKISGVYFNYANTPLTPVRYALVSSAQQQVFDTLVYQSYFLNFGKLRAIALYTDSNNYIYAAFTDPVSSSITLEQGYGYTAYVPSIDGYSTDLYIYRFTQFGFIYYNTLSSIAEEFVVPENNMLAFLGSPNTFGQPSIARNFVFNSNFTLDSSFNSSSDATPDALTAGSDLWRFAYRNYGTSYNDAYAAGRSDGETVGYTNGYTNGYNVGYGEGDTIGYKRGYNAGEQAGYNNGYQIGLTEGYDNGYDAGYDVGITEGGYKDGYDVGYAEGLILGRDEGYDQGYNAGYNIGYNDGLDDLGVQLDIGSIFDAIMSGTYNLIHTAFGFELFGVNVAGLLMLIVGVVIIVFVVRFIWGFVA